MNIDAASLTKQLNAHALATRSNRVEARPGLLQAWFARWRLWQRMRRDEAWLRRQPDYLLRDIGLERNEITTIVRQGRF
ncbi:hypothetical protein [Dongia sp.]|uniref:hypothetical protein n=1 Tax=Dongia sp. TaxID=1977262 RepID=UPI0037516CE7